MYLTKTLLNRIRWNYFNDIVYVLYFYVMLFAFCQLRYIGNGVVYVSDVFGVLFVGVGCVWPVGVTVMLYLKNKGDGVFRNTSNTSGNAHNDN